MRAYNVQINVGDLDHELLSLSDADLASWAREFGLAKPPLPHPPVDPAPEADEGRHE